MPSPAHVPVILVVDDNDGIRQMLQTALRALQFDVRLAATGESAVEIYAAEPSDVVLMDVQMPVLDGPQTLAVLQQIDPRVRCCFMSANSGAYSKEELLRRGALCVLPKPFRLAELRRALLDALAQSHGEDAS